MRLLMILVNMLSPQILIAIDCILESSYSTKRVKQAQDYEQAQVKFKMVFLYNR